MSLEWLRRVFDPQTREQASGKPSVSAMASAPMKSSRFWSTVSLIRSLCRLLSHTSHKLQPCEIAVFAPLKTAYRENVGCVERGGVNTVGKQHFTSLYSTARETAFSKRNILSGWSESGLFVFNPQSAARYGEAIR